MYSIETATVVIVVSMLLLMMTGMPLGIVTLTVSIGTALVFFGEPGLFLVASNVQGLLENYSLVAVPLFVLMANLLERSGVAEDLFNAMSIIGGKLRGGVAVQTTLVAVIMAAILPAGIAVHIMARRRRRGRPPRIVDRAANNEHRSRTHQNLGQIIILRAGWHGGGGDSGQRNRQRRPKACQLAGQ